MNFDEVPTNTSNFHEWNADGSWEATVQKLRNASLTLQHQILKALSKHGVNIIKYHVGVLLQFLRACLQQRARRALLQLAHDNKYAKIIGRCAVQYLKRRAIMIEAMVKHWNDMVHMDATGRTKSVISITKTHEPLWRLFLHKPVGRTVKMNMARALYSQRMNDYVRSLRKGMYITPALRMKPEQLFMIERTKKQQWIQRANELSQQSGHRGSMFSRSGSVFVSLNNSAKRIDSKAFAEKEEDADAMASPVSSAVEDDAVSEVSEVQPALLEEEVEEEEKEGDDFLDDFWDSLPTDTTPIELCGNASTSRTKPKGRSPFTPPLPRYRPICPPPPRSPSPKSKRAELSSASSKTAAAAAREKLPSLAIISDFGESSSGSKPKRETVKFAFPSPRPLESTRAKGSSPRGVPVVMSAATAEGFGGVVSEGRVTPPPSSALKKVPPSEVNVFASSPDGAETSFASRVRISFQSNASDLDSRMGSVKSILPPSPAKKLKTPPKAGKDSSTTRSRIITEESLLPSEIIDDFALSSPVYRLVRPHHHKFASPRLPRSHVGPRPPSPSTPPRSPTGAAAKSSVVYCPPPSIPSTSHRKKPSEGLVCEGTKKPKFQAAAKVRRIKQAVYIPVIGFH